MTRTTQALAHEPQYGLVIDCDERIADEHDDPACTCEHCARWYAGADERATMREARSLGGGLFPLAHTLLGPGWLEEKGGVLAKPATMAHLAQRALGDVFAQLERVGTQGRERCLLLAHYYSSPPPELKPEQQLKRSEALELIRLAENALDYARVHLDYLQPDEMPAPALPVSDRVVVHDEECTWSGRIVREGEPTDGADEVTVEADDGTTHRVHVRDLRRIAV